MKAKAAAPPITNRISEEATTASPNRLAREPLPPVRNRHSSQTTTGEASRIPEYPTTRSRTVKASVGLVKASLPRLTISPEPGMWWSGMVSSDRIGE